MFSQRRFLPHEVLLLGRLLRVHSPICATRRKHRASAEFLADVLLPMRIAHNQCVSQVTLEKVMNVFRDHYEASDPVEPLLQAFHYITVYMHGGTAEIDSRQSSHSETNMLSYVALALSATH